jgi:hypothetical protein
VFFGDVAQQVLFAQQLGWHAFSLGALERMHEATGNCSGDAESATVSATPIRILLNVTLRD